MAVVKMSCAFTGHRPQKLPWRYDESAAAYVALKDALAGEIARLASGGVTDYLSGMAEGTDTWAALAVLALRAKNPALKLHCILPCKEQADGWSKQAQALYRSVLGQADSIVYVSREYHKSCMLERNRFLVDHTQILLAVYNGEYRGGTAATVRYARKLGRRLTVIDPLTRQIIRCDGGADIYKQVACGSKSFN